MSATSGHGQLAMGRLATAIVATRRPLNCRQPTCQIVWGDIPDAAVAHFAVEALSRDSIDPALAVSE